MGRSAEGIERRKQRDRERSKKKYADPEFRARKLAQQKLHSEKNPEKQRTRAAKNYYKNREKRIKQRVEWAQRNKDRQLAYQREYYAKNRKRLLETIKLERDNRNPTRGLAKLILRAKRGDLPLDELLNIIRERTIQIDAKFETPTTRHNSETE